MKLSKKMRQERAEIEDALHTAVEKGEAVARYRERTGHNGGSDDRSFGALKHAENKMRLEAAVRRLRLDYERYGVGSDHFNGMLYEYLQALNANWYQKTHAALSEHRDDLVTELYLEMIDPANSSSGASIFSFKGVRSDGTLVPVDHFVNRVFELFFMAKERTQRQHDFKHFRLVDDSDTVAPIGDVRVGQLEKLREKMPPAEEEKTQNAFADLSVFGLKGKQFTKDFESRSDVHLLVIALLRQNADISGAEIVQKLKNTRFTVVKGGTTFKVIEPMEVHERTVQRVKKAFFDGLRSITEEHIKEIEQKKKIALEKAGLTYTTPDISNLDVLAKKVYGSMMARAGKPVLRHHVETKESRLKAQKTDPNYIERTFPNDGPRLGGTRQRKSMDGTWS